MKPDENLWGNPSPELSPDILVALINTNALVDAIVKPVLKPTSYNSIIMHNYKTGEEISPSFDRSIAYRVEKVVKIMPTSVPNKFLYTLLVRQVDNNPPFDFLSEDRFVLMSLSSDISVVGFAPTSTSSFIDNYTNSPQDIINTLDKLLKDIK